MLQCKVRNRSEFEAVKLCQFQGGKLKYIADLHISKLFLKKFQLRCMRCKNLLKKCYSWNDCFFIQVQCQSFHTYSRHDTLHSKYNTQVEIKAYQKERGDILEVTRNGSTLVKCKYSALHLPDTFEMKLDSEMKELSFFMIYRLRRLK